MLQKTIKTRYPIRATMATDDSCDSEIRLYEFVDLQKALGEKDKQPLNLIDVREESEIKETGMVPGAVHVPCKYKYTLLKILLRFRSIYSNSVILCLKWDKLSQRWTHRKRNLNRNTSRINQNKMFQWFLCVKQEGEVTKLLK